MRLVLDTNVLIAAFISHGSCSELLEHCALNHQIVLSEFILDELKEKLTGKFRFTPREAAAAAHLLKSRSVVVSTAPLASPICRDSDDDNIIATAIAGQCVCIITGDKDLLDLGEPYGIQVLSPGSFWQFEQA
jgi:putative PIN family toxin of toxin-antitoxin system